MSQQRFLSPDRLYERPFAAAHPFVRTPGAARRWSMMLIFMFLCATIGAYLFVTDVKRVQYMAEQELSRLLGGQVSIGRAKLSIFEGLRLERVQVFTSSKWDDPRAKFFSANTFLVNYDAKALLTGRLRLTQIIAIDPQVQLIEDLDTGRWNYQSMMPDRSGGGGGRGDKKMPALPEIILRNAQIDYTGVRKGQLVSRGSMTIEGQLAPSSDGERYSFELQSRGGDVLSGAVTVGPTVSGALIRNTGQVTAQLRDFQFGRDIRSMLPAQVRSWWDRHALNGAIDKTVVSYLPPSRGEPAKFKVETDLDGVEMTVQPVEWMSREEIEAHEIARNAFDVLQDAGLDHTGVITTIANLTEPLPIQLASVKGRFTFTDRGITIGELDERGNLSKPVSGALEQNGFSLNGHIDGYSPLAQATIHLVSNEIQIPKTPRYITSMPRAVRELYDHLRPSGTAKLDITVTRPTLGSRIDIAGGVTIVDGNFVFDKFPYPVRNAVGSVMFGYDPATQMDRVKIDIRGKGAAGGPNAESDMRIAGQVAPLNGDPSVVITVFSNSVRDEPILYQAFPKEVKAALKGLDADGKGEFPKYHGAFECRVNRPVGPHQDWIVETDIVLDDAAGKMEVFPYLLEHVSGRLEIREGFVDIKQATMKKGDSWLVIDGRVTWRAGIGRPLEPGEVLGKATKPRPDLKVTARNVPIDKALLDAMPPDRREWMETAGLTGKIDIDGRVWRPSAQEAAMLPPSSEDSQLTHSFDVTLRDGTIWPFQGTSVVTALAAKLHLLPDGITLTEVRGKRGEGELAGRGEIRWPKNNASIFMSGTASKLALDPTLYRVLPSVAQKAWDAVKPDGSVDLDMTYRGRIANPKSEISNPASQPSTQPAIPDLDLILHPRGLSATVQAVPYRLDGLTGTVRVQGNKVTLTDVSGKHGQATVRVAGNGTVLEDQSQWDLRVSADAVKVDDDFRKALPPGLLSVVDSLKLTGNVGFNFSKLAVKTLPASDVVIPLAEPSAPVDVDFGVKLTLNDASLDVGVPLTKVRGGMNLTGTVRNSKLAAFEGPVDLPELIIAGRAASDLHAEFYKPADQDALRIGHLNGQLAGGEVAGQVDLAFPEVGPGLYKMDLVLRNADVRQLSADSAPGLSGELSASLALEGDWANTNSRRGRGDVAVHGREMYKIPLVLGLMQITNLSLPITSPFSEGSARYMVEGETVTFDSLELRSRDMLMSGSGQLNFGTKKVAMTFTTDNPNWPKVPIIGDIVQTAKHELLQIHVRGSFAESSAASTPGTVTTTVDDVQRGDNKKKD
jgi:hypothetical protein